MKNIITFTTQDSFKKAVHSSAVLYTVENPIGTYFIHHGTIFTNDMAPTNAIMYDAIANLFLKKRFNVVFPDYIGFGVSYENSFHPYLHKQTLAQNSLDLLYYLYEKNLINKESKILSAGYSEGGYASLAFVALAQKNSIIIDSINGAAPYDILKSLHNVLKQSTYAFPEFMSYTLHSYEKIYSLQGLTQNLLNGIYSKITYRAYEERFTFERMHRIYPNDISQLINLDFFYGESELINVFKAKLAENSLSTSMVTGNTIFFSSKYDEVVDVSVSKDIYQVFKKYADNKVTLIVDEDKTSHHFGSYPKFLKLVLMGMTSDY